MAMARKTLTREERSYLSALGERVRSARVDQGLTQDQLVAKAKACGIGMSRRTLGAIEKGIHNISVVSAVGLLRALDSDLEEWESGRQEVVDACRTVVDALGDPARRVPAQTAISLLQQHPATAVRQAHRKREKPPPRKKTASGR